MAIKNVAIGKAEFVSSRGVEDVAPYKMKASQKRRTEKSVRRLANIFSRPLASRWKIWYTISDCDKIDQDETET